MLTVEALETYNVIEEETAYCYSDLKAALLTKFDVSLVTYTTMPP